MIGSLRGELAEVMPLSDASAEAIVEVGGVGYRVTVSPSTAANLGQPGDRVELAIHTHVREMAITLYGFGTGDERRCFELLLGAHGVGPALALAILGVHPPDVLGKIVATEDVDALTLVPGVGKKTAARLLVELQSRLTEITLPHRASRPVPGGDRAALTDVAEALAGLGYAPDEVRAALQAVTSEADSAEDLLRAALRHLGRPR